MKKILDKADALEKIKQLRAEGKTWLQVGSELGVSGPRACQIASGWIPKPKVKADSQPAQENAPESAFNEDEVLRVALP